MAPGSINPCHFARLSNTTPSLCNQLILLALQCLAQHG